MERGALLQLRLEAAARLLLLLQLRAEHAQLRGHRGAVALVVQQRELRLLRVKGEGWGEGEGEGEGEGGSEA